MNEKIDAPLLSSTPKLFPGAIADWPALQLWAGPSGIQRLINLAGDVPVEIMVSPASAKNFRGDMQSLVLLQENFSTFLNGSLDEAPVPSSTMQFYLAQCPVSSLDSASGQLLPGPLSALQQDFNIPFSILESLHLLPPNSTVDNRNNISQVNFWANIHSPVTSSLHYDPYQNLLCVVTGQKIVRLLPPSATKYLHGVAPVYHESANHADDDLFNPLRKQELSQSSLHGNHQLLEFILNPGDVLFLPEGWWHQVSSTAGTMAVNFWWESNDIHTKHVESNNLMSDYYYRRQVQEQTQKRKHEMLEEAGIHAWELNPVELYPTKDYGIDNYLEKNDLDTPLNPAETEYLIELKTLLAGEPQKAIELIETKILALLHCGALPFMRILRYLKKEFPGMVTVLLTEVDSPKFWEALTTGLEMKILNGEVESPGGSAGSREISWVEKAGGVDDVLAEFYDDLYSDKGCDRRVITARMLKFKEKFARKAFEFVVGLSSSS